MADFNLGGDQFDLSSVWGDISRVDSPRRLIALPRKTWLLTVDIVLIVTLVFLCGVLCQLYHLLPRLKDILQKCFFLPIHLCLSIYLLFISSPVVMNKAKDRAVCGKHRLCLFERLIHYSCFDFFGQSYGLCSVLLSQ